MLTAESVKRLGKALAAASELNRSEVSPAGLGRRPRSFLATPFPHAAVIRPGEKGATVPRRLVKTSSEPPLSWHEPGFARAARLAVFTLHRSRLQLLSGSCPSQSHTEECLQLLTNLENGVEPTEALLKVRLPREPHQGGSAVFGLQAHELGAN